MYLILDDRTKQKIEKWIHRNIQGRWTPAANPMAVGLAEQDINCEVGWL